MVGARVAVAAVIAVKCPLLSLACAAHGGDGGAVSSLVTACRFLLCSVCSVCTACLMVTGGGRGEAFSARDGRVKFGCRRGQPGSEGVNFVPSGPTGVTTARAVSDRSRVAGVFMTPLCGQGDEMIAFTALRSSSTIVLPFLFARMLPAGRPVQIRPVAARPSD